MLSAVSGIAKGIQWLSNINMVLAILLAVFVFVVGPTIFILNMLPSAMGSYLAAIAMMSARTGAEGADVNTWLQSWTIAALSFVLVMLGMAVALVKDLRRDPMVMRRQYASEAVDSAVIQGVTEHGDDFIISVEKDPEAD